MEIIVTKQNLFTQSWSVTAGVGTITISAVNLWDLGITSLVRIEDVTQSTVFGISGTTTFSQTFTAGLPTYTWVFTNLPAGTVTGDTILVYLDVSPIQAELSLLGYQKA